MLNEVQLIGSVGRIEVRYSKNDELIVNISLATSETWKDKQGNKQEKTEWHNVVLFGGVAKIAQQYVSKGSKLYVKGKLQTRKWDDNNGNTRYTTEIVLNGFDSKMLMLSKGQKQNNTKKQKNEPVDNHVDDSDIPF